METQPEPEQVTSGCVTRSVLNNGLKSRPANNRKSAFRMAGLTRSKLFFRVKLVHQKFVLVDSRVFKSFSGS